MSSEPPSTAHPPPPNQNTTTTNPDTNPDTEMPDSASPSPQDADAASEEKATPPPPPPPVPGPRAARLQALFATTARHSLDKISKENFAACFPTVASRAPGTLEFVQRQMVERLGGLWNKEFEAIMANRQVVARLNELESLVADATRRRLEAPDPTSPPVAPHTLPAQTILTAHLRPHTTSQRTHLTTQLQTTQAANARLWEEIQAQRAETEALLSAVEKVLRDVEGATALLGGVADELAAETRAAEGDVRAVNTTAGASSTG